MAVGKVTQLYSDIGKSEPIYPKTNAKCVYTDDGNRIDTLPRFNFMLTSSDTWTENTDGSYELDKTVNGVKAGMTAFLMLRRGQADGGSANDFGLSPDSFDEDSEKLSLLRACYIKGDNTVHFVAMENMASYGTLYLKLVVII